MFRIEVFYDYSIRRSIVTVFDNSDNRIVFVTPGYLEYGYHLRKRLRVFWSTNQRDFYVKDLRGTLDAYIYNGSGWDGPFQIIRTIDDSGCEHYWTILTSYGYQDGRILASHISEYDKSFLPSSLQEVYLEDGYIEIES